VLNTIVNLLCVDDTQGETQSSVDRVSLKISDFNIQLLSFSAFSNGNPANERDTDAENCVIPGNTYPVYYPVPGLLLGNQSFSGSQFATRAPEKFTSTNLHIANRLSKFTVFSGDLLHDLFDEKL
jgi:hypothetical protein